MNICETFWHKKKKGKGLDDPYILKKVSIFFNNALILYQQITYQHKAKLNEKHYKTQMQQIILIHILLLLLIYSNI